MNNLSSTKNSFRKYLAAFLLGIGITHVPASLAIEWNDTTIGDIINDVGEIKGQVIGTGPIPTVAREFNGQLADLAGSGPILRDTIQELLQVLRDREGPLAEFRGSPRCAPGTECDIFREQLGMFVSDLAALRGNFPAIEQLGFGDGSRIRNLIDQTPPVFLFLPYEILSRVPQWQDIPMLLQELIDLVGDRELFTLNLPSRSEQEFLELQAVQFDSTGADPTPTEQFCMNHANRIDPSTDIDPVRLRRIQFSLSIVNAILDVLTGAAPDRWNIAIVGEGTDAPVNLKLIWGTIKAIVVISQNAAQTFRANLQVCRDRNNFLETSIAQCTQHAEFVLPGTRDEMFTFVEAAITHAENVGVPVDKSRDELINAANKRDKGNFRAAYRRLCKAYSKIGLTDS